MVAIAALPSAACATRLRTPAPRGVACQVAAVALRTPKRRALPLGLSPSGRAASRSQSVARASASTAQPGPAGPCDEARQPDGPVSRQSNMPFLFVAAIQSAAAQVASAFKRLNAPVGGVPGLQLAAAAPLAALSATLGEIQSNVVFMSALYAWAAAQVLKVFTKYARTRSWDMRVLFDSGGMPSSHTALVIGLTAAIALQHGFNSTLFPLSLAFSLVVMYDAAGVRRHAGKQAEVLNALVEDYFQGHPVSEQELKEVIGHTPLQVAMGAVLGIAMAIFYRRYVM